MKTITAEELEKKFDNNEDISEYMDLSKAQKLSSFLEQNNNIQQEIKINFPISVIDKLDRKIQEIGIDRENFIKMIVAERLEILNNKYI